MTNSNSNTPADNSSKYTTTAPTKMFNGQWDIVLACDIESPNIAVAVEVFDLMYAPDKGLMSIRKDIKVFNVPGCMNDFSYPHHVIIAKWSTKFKYVDFMVCSTCGERLIGTTNKCEGCFKKEWDEYTARCKACAIFRDAGTCAECVYDICPVEEDEKDMSVELTDNSVLRAIVVIESKWSETRKFYFNTREVTEVIFGDGYTQHSYNLVTKAIYRLKEAGIIVDVDSMRGFTYTTK